MTTLSRKVKCPNCDCESFHFDRDIGLWVCIGCDDRFTLARIIVEKKPPEWDKKKNPIG